jgi:transglutaminase-like putative cysteine protease
MQRFKIIHRTCYSYSAEVILGPHTLLLRPREDHELRIENFSLSLTPLSTLLWHRDVEGNSVAIANFAQPAMRLMVESEVTIQQYNEAPLDFMVADYAMFYPFVYQPDDKVLLSPYIQLPTQEAINEVKQWVATFWHPHERIQTYTLLQRLASGIHATMSYRVREEPGVQTALQTLFSKTGSCRDFALLFMEAARCLGFASRFVSGYLHAPLMSHEIGTTHAWAEIYLPGAGWKGFDPTIGEIAGSDHIAVAVARLPESVPPIAGSFVGTSGSVLEVGVWVSKY